MTKPTLLPVILYLAENFPFSIDGGSQQRIAATILTLTQAHRVHLLCFHPTKISETEQKKIFQNFANQVPLKFKSNLVKRLSWTVIFEPKIHQPIRPLSWLSEFWSNQPFLIWQYQSQSFKTVLSELLAKLQPDIVHVCHLRMAGFLPNWLLSANSNINQKIPQLIYEPENVEWQLAKSQAEFLPILGRWRWWWQREAGLIKKFETQIIKKFDLVLTLSPEDAADLKTLGAKNVLVWPILYPATLNPSLPQIPTSQPPSLPIKLIFVGNLNWLPNADAMRWFVNFVWPKIASQNSNVQLIIAGQKSDFIKLDPKVAAHRVTFTGFVKNLEPLLAKTQVAILPFRMGGGVRFKALTAAWAGQAIVSTPLGTQGLSLKSPTNFLSAKTADNFAAAILNLINHPEKIVQMGRENQAYLRQNHGLNQAEKNLTSYKKLSQADLA